MAERSLRFDLIARDKSFSRTLDQMGRKGQSLNRKLERSFGDSGGRAGQQYGMRFSQRLGTGLSASTRVARLGGAAIGAGLAVAGLAKFAADSVKLATTFDKTMRQVASVTGVPVKRIGELRKVALNMGATTSFSARQAGDAMLELGKGGLTFAEQKAGGLSATLTLAAAGSLELGDAAGFVVQGLRAFGLRANQAATVSAALAGAANASTSSVEDMGLALSQTAAGARNAGLNIQETTGVLAAFANNGIKGSDAGTSLKTMLQRLVPTTNAAKDKMRELNLSFVDAHGSILPITEIAQRLQNRLGGLSEAQRTAALSTIFGSDATRAATILMREGSTGLAKYIKATSDRGAAEKLAKTNTEGAAGAFERLQGAIETIQIQIGDAFLPVLADLANWLARVLPQALARVQQALATMGHWWAENRSEIDLIAQALATTFTPAADNAASSTNGLTSAASGLADALSRTAIGVARFVQGFNQVGLAAQYISFTLANGVQAVGNMANAIDFASRGFGLFGDRAGHAGDGIVRLGQSMEQHAVNTMNKARGSINSAGAAINGLETNSRNAAAAANQHATALANEKAAVDDLKGALRGEETAELDVRQAKLNVASAQRRLTELTHAGKRGSIEYRQAQIDLKRAKIDLREKTDALRAATAKSTDAERTAASAATAATPKVHGLGESGRVSAQKLLTLAHNARDARTAINRIPDKHIDISGSTSLHFTKSFTQKDWLNARLAAGRMAEGGRITKGSGPTADDVPILVSKGETVVPADDSRRPDFRAWAGARGIPGFAQGGLVGKIPQTDQAYTGVGKIMDRWGTLIMAAGIKKALSSFGKPGILNFIRSVDPLPYVWGHAGPRDYDCSGLVGAVYGKHTGKGGGNGQRYFTTGTIGSVAGGLGLRSGLGGVLEIGVTAGTGHMAGRYGGPRGLGFEAESSRTGIKIGSAASRPESFARHFTMARGGRIDADMLERFAKLGLDIGGDADKLRVNGKVFDRGGYLMPGTTIAHNRTGRPERVLAPDPAVVVLDPASIRAVAREFAAIVQATPLRAYVTGNDARNGIRTSQRREGIPPIQQVR